MAVLLPLPLFGRQDQLIDGPLRFSTRVTLLLELQRFGNEYARSATEHYIFEA